MATVVEPTPRRPQWEPEPLHLPAEMPEHDAGKGNTEQDSDGERDLPGSHVVVIDLS